MSTIRVIDFETTGVPSEDHPAAVIEAAYHDVVLDTEGMVASLSGSCWSTFVKTVVSIDVEARAVHHITDAEIEHGIPVEHAYRGLGSGDVDFFCAHNADVEKQFFTGGDRPWLDTYKIALRLWPDAPGHGNQVLRYWLKLDLDPDLASPPHRALPDCFVTAHILVAAISVCHTRAIPIADLAKWSRQPPLLVRVGFGKHRGKKWVDVDSGYLRWCLEQDMDKAVKHTARTILKQRESTNPDPDDSDPFDDF